MMTLFRPILRASAQKCKLTAGRAEMLTVRQRTRSLAILAAPACC